MNDSFSRREVLGLLTAAGTSGLWSGIASAVEKDFRIRTITGGVLISTPENIKSLEATASFLGAGRKTLANAGYEVQTIRMASQPLGDYLDWRNDKSIEQIQQLDSFAVEFGCMLSLGPINNATQDSEEFSAWATEMIATTRNVSCSMIVTGMESDLDWVAIQNSARIMRGLSRATEGGA